MAPGQVSPRITVAIALAQVLLEGVGERWQHTTGVARRAGELVEAVGLADREMLIAAAWLHDIGYSPALWDTGFHPLDGARYLRRHGWPHRLSGLAAYHSGAGYVADQLGLRAELNDFDWEVSPLSDALAYADQTTGPDGQPVTILQRMAEMLARHGDGSPQAKAHQQRAPYLLAAAQRVEQRLLVPPLLRL